MPGHDFPPRENVLVPRLSPVDGKDDVEEFRVSVEFRGERNSVFVIDIFIFLLLFVDDGNSRCKV